MENTFEFELSLKNYGKIMRWKKRWMILGALGLLLALIADGVFFGLSLINRWEFTAIFIAIIPVLSIAYGALWFVAVVMDGGIRIYGKCCMSFTEDGKIKVSCERRSFNNATVEVGKTLSPKGIIEHKGFYIVLGEKRDWLALPGDAPISQIKELIK